MTTMAIHRHLIRSDQAVRGGFRAASSGRGTRFADMTSFLATMAAHGGGVSDDLSELGICTPTLRADPFSCSPDDLQSIEKRMRQIIAGRHPFVRQELSADEARQIFKGHFADLLSQLNHKAKTK